jgi:hypothetical protein
MRQPKVTTPLVGASGAKGLTGDDTKNFTTHGSAACQCRLNPGCLVCRRWSKTINGGDAKRAESLRRQSMGDLMRAGG